MIVYLDNASTTKPSEAATAASLDAFTLNYGNPSSAHSMGQDAERIVKNARLTVAASLGARPEQIVFTGSGTEANNLAVHTAFGGRAFGGRTPLADSGMIFTSPVEHPSVAAPIARFAELGAQVSVLSTDACGTVDCGALGHAMDEAFRRGEAKRALISVMHVNNELGTIQPVAEIARVKAGFAETTGAEILLHTDAVQSFCKVPIDVTSAMAVGYGGFGGVDLLSCCAHKVHGPKGIGALYALRPEKVVPSVLGGGQERGMRSGTENVPGVAGFGAAVAERAIGNVDRSGGAAGSSNGLADSVAGLAGRTASLRSRLLRHIEDSIPDVRVNSPREASARGEPGLCSPYILNVSFLGTRGEVLLHDLEQQGVFVSTGSACSNIGKGAKRKNPVLAAADLTPAEAEGAIRFSFSRYTTEEEIDYAAEQVAAAVKRFRTLGTFR
ncbi:MAG: cysteine desulfurase [Clostridiales Family XIII bacterium]|jgi:cysteine desulfurase|nr:cysteine desulfurase [Clostridiales Family XIII bacterium]